MNLDLLIPYIYCELLLVVVYFEFYLNYTTKPIHYYLPDQKQKSADEKFGWIAIKLVLIISFIFLLQNLFPTQTNKFVLKSSEVLYQPWTLITYVFMHGSFSHLYSNMFALALFGSILEKVIGEKNFLKVFLLTGIFSGFFGIFFYNSLIGASGSIFGIMGVLAILRPKLIVWVLGAPMPMAIAIIVYAALDLGGIFYPTNVANIGHLSALSLGISIGLAWRKKYEIKEPKKEKRIEISEAEIREWEKKYMNRK